jgi:hypothetical protein
MIKPWWRRGCVKRRLDILHRVTAVVVDRAHCNPKDVSFLMCIDHVTCLAVNTVTGLCKSLLHMLANYHPQAQIEEKEQKK